MTSRVDQAGAAVFGSRTRGLVLGFLAQASKPSTGYAVAKAVEVGVSKVYPELRRLERAGIVRAGLDERGSKTFSLVDEDLRRFVRRTVPMMTTEEWFSEGEVAKRRDAAQRARKLKVRLPQMKPIRGKRPFADEFRRPRSKDRAAARARRWRA